MAGETPSAQVGRLGEILRVIVVEPIVPRPDEDVDDS